MQIVLFEPEIPQNTGNIIRTCSVTGTGLVLVHPLGFSFDSKQLKRARLDYLSEVDITHVYDFEAFLKKRERENLVFFSSKASQPFSSITYNSESCLIFGSETQGLPASVTEQYADRLVTIPMIPDRRCLNLATSAGIGIYHALFQQDFKPLVNCNAV
ncbi:tRNA (uridine(34)/cytosine(34)/5-carboxymethylaminomethyluridine(34)-2'-O)-methyltransferase TrmL [Candidatus Aerophobetes bacterium]|uniref:Putative tRNA (cytidine(34)-2'-O)-methyltransferase n=1 Tax=Aerophobetes bacterium TaxID=2030807 RepID=A0A2A4X1C3_UNCAE|nr:MAG: tRNA (uridine(34)/cytosine(34)/5-carboxymethylaminomethyluridine(34)-2'-O)-methyltransferase TrmL [Candidatus Aerophobetes bacterium]